LQSAAKRYKLIDPVPATGGRANIDRGIGVATRLRLRVLDEILERLKLRVWRDRQGKRIGGDGADPSKVVHRVKREHFLHRRIARVPAGSRMNTGVRNGSVILKIRRFVKTSMPVRVRFQAPDYINTSLGAI